MLTRLRVPPPQLFATHGGGKYKKMLKIKDSIADITLQQVRSRGNAAQRCTQADAFPPQVLTRPDEFDVIATLNLNGDYLSDALAAQVGGIGIAPGVSALLSRCFLCGCLTCVACLHVQGNINYKTGHAIFEATHGTAPK